MNDPKVCRTCCMWTEKDCCGFFFATGVTRRSAGRYEKCEPIKKGEKLESHENKAIRSHNAKLSAIKRLIDEGLSSSEVGGKVGYAPSTINRIAREHGWKCSSNTKGKILTVRSKKNGMVLAHGTQAECAAQAKIGQNVLSEIINGKRVSRTLIVEVAG